MFWRPALPFSLFLILSLPALCQSGPAPVESKPVLAPDNPNTAPAVARPSPTPVKVIRPSELAGRPKVSNEGRLELIKALDAEFVHARKVVPLGDKSTAIAPDGEVKPGDAKRFQVAMKQGTACKVGDRVQITNILIKDSSIYLEINGGPKHKTKWYEHVSVGIGNGPMNEPKEVPATGAAITVEFKDHVPQMSGEELKAILTPVLDFSVRSAAEIYVEKLPPKIREAIKNHEVLVGMNKDMVMMAKDRPQQKLREKDDQGKDYEEWIYGVPPKDVIFIRLQGDEVTQVKTAQAGGQIVVKTEKEVTVQDGQATLASLKSTDNPEDKKTPGPQPEQRTKRPSLKRPDEAPDPAVPQQNTQQGESQTQQGPHPDEPEWGTNGSKSPNGQTTGGTAPASSDPSKPPL